MVVVDPEARKQQQQQQEAVEGEELDQHGDLYSPRTSVVGATHGGRVYLFGGVARSSRVDDLYALDTATTTWTLTEPTSDLRPGPRSLAGGVVVGDRLYVFGGRSKSEEYSGTLFAFDFATRQWEELPSKWTPAGRVDFVMAAHGQELIVFGGYGGKKRYNDLFLFSLVTSTWRSIAQSGLVPSRRFGHSGVVHAGKLVVFGGWDGYDTLDDLYALDLKSYAWERMHATGEAPSHRYRHSAVVYGSSMLVFGGIDKQKCRFNDLYRLDLLTNTWTKVQIHMRDGKPLPIRTFHAMVVVDDKLLVLGGYDGEKRLNTLHAIDLKPKQKTETEEETLAMCMRIVVRL